MNHLIAQRYTQAMLYSQIYTLYGRRVVHVTLEIYILWTSCSYRLKDTRVGSSSRSDDLHKENRRYMAAELETRHLTQQKAEHGA